MREDGSNSFYRSITRDGLPSPRQADGDLSEPGLGGKQVGDFSV